MKWKIQQWINIFTPWIIQHGCNTFDLYSIRLSLLLEYDTHLNSQTFFSITSFLFQGHWSWEKKCFNSLFWRLGSNCTMLFNSVAFALFLLSIDSRVSSMQKKNAIRHSYRIETMISIRFIIRRSSKKNGFHSDINFLTVVAIQRSPMEKNNRLSFYK